MDCDVCNRRRCSYSLDGLGFISCGDPHVRPYRARLHVACLWCGSCESLDHRVGRWNAKRVFPADPGHWLLLFCAVGAIADGITTAAFRTYDGSPSYYWRNVQQLSISMIGAVICLSFERRMRSGCLWSATLLLPACVLTASAIIHGLAILGYRHLNSLQVLGYLQTESDRLTDQQ